MQHTSWLQSKNKYALPDSFSVLTATHAHVHHVWFQPLFIFIHIIILENTAVVGLSVINHLSTPTAFICWWWLLLCCYIYGVERTNTNVLHIAEQTLQTHYLVNLKCFLCWVGHHYTQFSCPGFVDLCTSVFRSFYNMVGVGGHHALAAVWLGKSPIIQSTWNWVGPKAGLDGAEKEISFALSGFKPQNFQPSRSCYTHDTTLALTIVFTYQILQIGQ